MKKTMVLLSILALLCWVPSAFAIEGVGDWDGAAAQGQLMDQTQGGQAVFDADGNTIGGLMGQESEMIQEMKAGGIATASVDPCVDCPDDKIAIGGAYAHSEMGVFMEEGQRQGQAQIGVFGHISIDKQEWWELKTTKKGEFNSDGTKTFSLNKTETSDYDKTFDLTKTESHDSDWDFHADVDANKTFDVEADATFVNENVNKTENESESDEGPPATESSSETNTNTNTHSFDGALGVDKHFDAEINADGSRSDDWSKTVDVDKTEDLTETKTVEVVKTWDKHNDFELECTVVEHHQKTLTFDGNGVAGVQYGGGYQYGTIQGYANAGAMGGSLDYNPIVRPTLE